MADKPAPPFLSRDKEEPEFVMRDRVLSRGNSHIRGSGHSLMGSKPNRGSFYAPKSGYVLFRVLCLHLTCVFL
jgi:hypothetical protein